MGETLKLQELEVLYACQGVTFPARFRLGTGRGEKKGKMLLLPYLNAVILHTMLRCQNTIFKCYCTVLQSKRI